MLVAPSGIKTCLLRSEINVGLLNQSYVIIFKYFYILFDLIILLFDILFDLIAVLTDLVDLHELLLGD